MNPGDDRGRPRRTDGPHSVSTTAPSKAPIATDQPALTGIDRALAGASPWDKSTIIAAIKARAANPGAFTVEEALELAGIVIDADHPNIVGAAVQSAAKLGVIERVSYTRAKRPSRAGAVVAVWLGTQHTVSSA